MAGRPVASRQERARAQELAQRIRALREARGWTRERLAKEAGLHTRTLVRLESEGPGPAWVLHRRPAGGGARGQPGRPFPRSRVRRGDLVGRL
ncbi:helix-turn-helix transcriptional regulator [Streptomyces murinus]|uniref:helix-turn-helix transcriptional regulator n=1 Tax=Streptomyces murinus TaxID=33900 RepID=UPI003827A0FC